MDTVQTAPRKRPQYRVEILPRQYSILVFDEAHSVNYLSSCQVTVQGDFGQMYGINGRRFYDALASKVMVEQIMNTLGVTSLEGYVMPSHARLMRFVLRHAAIVDEMHTGQMAGHEMVWVRVRCLG